MTFRQHSNVHNVSVHVPRIAESQVELIKVSVGHNHSFKHGNVKYTKLISVKLIYINSN